jgi:fumigallin biosynthesis monooxygenase-like protein
MPTVIAQRMTAKVEGDFVVFLLGMRINHLWKIHKWLPVAMAMPRMLRELSQDPTSGYLGAESWFGNPTILLQYWRSFEDLDSYAKKTNCERRPAWGGVQSRRG